jgi:hypothetical protein
MTNENTEIETGIDPEALTKVQENMDENRGDAQHHFEIDQEKFKVNPPDGNRAFISVWDNVLSEQECTNIIEKFEEASEHHKKTEHAEYRSFTELNFFDPALKDMSKDFEDLSMLLLGKVSEYVESYRQHNNIAFFPNQCQNEEVRMKKYLAGSDDDFKYHADVGDYASARRFLVCFFYLNSVEEGGETVFPDYNTSITPERGRLAIFPPFWTHPHQAQPAISDDKYIVGTYLHYM